MLKIFNSKLFQLFSTVIATFLFHNQLPTLFKEAAYALSLSLKEILMFMLPCIIFSSVYFALSRITSVPYKGFAFISLLIISIMFSSFFGVLIAGVASYFIVFNGHCNIAVINTANIESLNPLWRFKLYSFPTLGALFISFFLAFISTSKIQKPINKIATIATDVSRFFLQKFFIPTLPLFIFGFVIKLLTDDMLINILSFNPKAVILMLCVLCIYLIILYIIATIKRNLPWGAIGKNLIAPGITTFSTMSSVAALPLSIEAASKNIGDSNIANVVMPSTVNIHMIGDAICIPLIAMLVLSAFGMPAPSISQYIIFAGLFTITKFSGVGVPGGSIFVMSPVLESVLGFSGEMTTLITIFYMLIDPITTTGNVIGNNLFIIYFDALQRTIGISSFDKKD